MPGRAIRGAVLPAIVALTLGCAIAQTGLERGRLLVATDRMRDAGFAKTVVLLVEHNRTRSVGVALNRRLGEPVSSLFPELKSAGASADPLWAGGPVPLGLNALIRARTMPPGAGIVTTGVYLLTERRLIRDLLADRHRATEVRVYAGLCSWGPGQLEDEVERRLWKTMAADAAVIFDPRPEMLWESLGRREPQAKERRPAP